jgi:hypothetical protein
MSTDTEAYKDEDPAPGAIRTYLVGAAMSAPQRPDLAQSVYQQLGLDDTGVWIHGVRDQVANLKPGDLIGWEGSQRPDGQYIGQLGVYAGNGELIEPFFGQQRRRKITNNEAVFGMPVYLPGDEEELGQG